MDDYGYDDGYGADAPDAGYETGYDAGADGGSPGDAYWDGGYDGDAGVQVDGSWE